MIHNEPGILYSNLSGKKALVLGGSGGIGKAIAGHLAASGAKLLVHGRNKEKLEECIRQFGANSSFIVAELQDGIAPEELTEAARNCDILVLSYAPFLYSSLANTKPEDWYRLSLACLALPGVLATEAAKSMAKRGFGRILFFGGTRTDAIRGYKMNAVYAAAKTALAVLVKSLAMEFGEQGLTCAMLCPGFVDTEYLDEETREKYRLLSPGQELISTDRLAALSLRIISSDMELVNGSIINADKGLYSF